jgi:hypothetical protein
MAPSNNSTNNTNGVPTRGGGQRKPFPFYGNASNNNNKQQQHSLRNATSALSLSSLTLILMNNRRGAVLLTVTLMIVVYLMEYQAVFHHPQNHDSIDGKMLSAAELQQQQQQQPALPDQKQSPPRLMNPERKHLLPKKNANGSSGEGGGGVKSPQLQQPNNLRQAPKENALQQQQQQPPQDVVTTIGYAVTITGCGSDPITEGAAVLQRSIHLASRHGPLGGRYDYKLYAIYHTDGEACALPLADLGYELLQRDTPVLVADIQGEYLRENIEKNGCCGEKELIKLEAYTLIQHPIVVHLDLDVLILKPLDALFDWMMFDTNNQDGMDTYDTSHVPIMWPQEDRPHQVNAFFTRDCK